MALKTRNSCETTARRRFSAALVCSAIVAALWLSGCDTLFDDPEALVHSAAGDVAADTEPEDATRDVREDAAPDGTAPGDATDAGEGEEDAAPPDPDTDDGRDGSAVAVCTGRAHSCALLENNEVVCWGSNELLQLGKRGAGDVSRTPVEVELEGEVTALDCGGAYTCAGLQSRGVTCWGSDNLDQLGDGADSRRKSEPVAVQEIESAPSDLSAGFFHSCLLEDGNGSSLKCWGTNRWNRAKVDSEELPVPVEAATGKEEFVQLSAGWRHVCALASDGQVFCWGYRKDGRLGDGSSEEESSSRHVRAGENQYLVVRVGVAHSCAITGKSEVECWGRNESGQLGVRGTDPEHTPTPVGDSGSSAFKARTLALGKKHTCAVAPDVGLVCWGANGEGQLGAELGDGVSARTSPGQGVETDHLKRLDVLEYDERHRGVWALDSHTMHTCAVLDSGEVACWGANGSGQLGPDSSRADSNEPNVFQP